MSLFDKRTHYKPFDYGWAFEAYDMQQKMHWLPSEVPLHEDVRDWNERLTPEEKNLIGQILKFFTQAPQSASADRHSSARIPCACASAWRILNAACSY